MNPVLEIRNLRVNFATAQGLALAVRGVDLSISPGQTLALVGESGSGKSALALAIPRLHQERHTAVEGQIILEGTHLEYLDEKAMHLHRGRSISMVFQDPMRSLNPLMATGAQVDEALKASGMTDRAQRRQRVLELFRLAGIPGAEQRLGQYPHQFSGGMLQRVAIIMAMACGSRLFIADEPTTALDVTVQAQVLALMDRYRQESDQAVLFITHDLGLVANHADTVAVMYAGRVVESGPVAQVMAQPAHPYTRSLLDALPKADRPGQRLSSIPGSPPSVYHQDAGCAFAPRCLHRQEKCWTTLPESTPSSQNRSRACHFPLATPQAEPQGSHP